MRLRGFARVVLFALLGPSEKSKKFIIGFDLRPVGLLSQVRIPVLEFVH